MRVLSSETVGPIIFVFLAKFDIAHYWVDTFHARSFLCGLNYFYYYFIIIYYVVITKYYFIFYLLLYFMY